MHARSRSRSVCCILLSCSLIGGAVALWPVVAAADNPKEADKKAADKKINDKIKEVAGTAEFLRSLPKRFATLRAVDAARPSVTFLIEGESLAKVWPLTADAEVKCAGWWGRLEQLTPGDRVWVWFKNDRSQQPVAVAMLADEISEQDIHGDGLSVVACGGGSIALKAAGAKTNRTLKAAKAALYRGGAKASLDDFKIGEKVYVQTTADGVRLLLDAAAFASRRDAQRNCIRRLWTEQGLPGTVVFLHIFSGEMEVMLDHETMRWARSLKLGDKVTLQASPPIKAVVKDMKPWRERTQLRLVVNGTDQADLTLGQRILLHMQPPAPALEQTHRPPDLGRPRSRAERIEWFLASIYCTCGIPGDMCTGHFYTLASCNPNGCGMPNHMRKEIAGLIDKGLSDEQIFDGLLKDQGPNLLKPHLMR
jgi:hypothetical protein